MSHIKTIEELDKEILDVRERMNVMDEFSFELYDLIRQKEQLEREAELEVI